MGPKLHTMSKVAHPHPYRTSGVHTPPRWRKPKLLVHVHPKLPYPMLQQSDVATAHSPPPCRE
eukprot:6890408-Pyramimonas_sp.AAC.1